MQTFEENKFEIGELKGISSKTIEEHLKLYLGYVKHSNLILEKLEEMSADPEKNSYAMSEVQRRFGFEYDGMRNHEVYFDSISGGPSPLAEDALLQDQIAKDFGSFDKWLAQFMMIASTRGVGWAMLYFDRKDRRLLNAWVDEHQIGQLVDCALVLALDMWEHAFVADYQPSGKKQYIDDFLANLNWIHIENNYTLI